jgi:hypothetical protein
MCALVCYPRPGRKLIDDFPKAPVARRGDLIISQGI